MDKSDESPENTSTASEVKDNNDKIDFSIDEADMDKNENTMKKKRSNKSRRLHLPKTRKGWLLLVVLLLVIVGAAFYLVNHGSSKKSTIAVLRTKTVAKSDLVPSTLSGLPVAPSINKIPVTGVMVENEVEARPQSGLSQAGVVFEALAEGGISRFLALYQDTAPSNVGPIRSARPYYVSWDMGFDGSYAHVGGSPDALTDIKQWGTKDLNEFYNGDSYHRITTREAPHNVYTSIADLNTLEQSKGFTSVNFKGFPRKVASPSKKPTATSISLNISYAEYNASYTYDASTNSYNRSEDGSAMIDANTNLQVSPKVVIAIVVPESQGALDASDAYYSNYSVIGSGAAYVFQDGIVTKGTWSKASNSAQITFTNSGGQTIKLDPGQTWITAMTNASQLTYGL
jgi:hypothetical protein